MSDDLGEPITGALSFDGGRVRLHEHGAVITVGSTDTHSHFRFPPIGRPATTSGTPARLQPFRRDAVSFVKPRDPELAGQLLRQALQDRIALLPTGTDAPAVTLAVGEPEIVRDEEPLGVGGQVRPAEYGLPLSCPPPPERQLHDVALRDDDGTWHRVAPHAAYHRADWSSFGLAHVTDTHVAQRIDRFREALERAKRPAAARSVYNFNDRFRGFVRYANQLHREGRLDVIIVTGDLVDYAFEDLEDELTGGNPAFLRRLILGQAPGPDFPDPEELLVPIFLTPGNHDYRREPYELVFDLNLTLVNAGPLGRVSRDVERVKNFSVYNIRQEDAEALQDVLNGGDGDDAGTPNLGVDRAARMVELVPDMEAHERHLGPLGTFVVELGKHRLVMIDSGSDVGVVSDATDALRVVLDMTNEDEETFIGGSPNCEGISREEFAVIHDALASAPGDGLVFLGLHAPLINPIGTQYPYFMRETLRPSNAEQATALLSYWAGLGGFGWQDARQKLREAFPSYFAGDRDHREPSFIVRGSTLDFLDFGVSRGDVDGLLAMLLDVSTTRAGTLVLAGHTHRHDEFVVRRGPTGEPTISMDFYTFNPRVHYAQKWNPEWTLTRTGEQTLPRVTRVELLPGAPMDPRPWPYPGGSGIDDHVQVPEYADPLDRAADARAWWERHPLLVLQTGALGPLDNSYATFTGFRLLNIRDDVVQRIDFLPTHRLEEAEYRLPYEDAIRVDPPRRHRYAGLSQRTGAAAPAGPPAALAQQALGATTVVYRDGSGHLLEVWRRGDELGTTDLTAEAGAAPAASDPSLWWSTTDSQTVALYRGTDGHVHSLYWSSGAVGHDALSESADGAKAAGRPVGVTQQDGTSYVVYRSDDGNLRGLWWRGGATPGHETLTTAAGAPLAAGDPAAWVDATDGTNIVAYRSSDGHVRSLHWTTGDVGHDDLSGVAGSPRAVGDPVGYHLANGDLHQVYYRGEDNHIHELWWAGEQPVVHGDLSAAAGAIPAVSDPVAWYDPGSDTKHVAYTGTDERVHELWWFPGRTAPEDVDLTWWGAAPTAVGRPTAVVAPDGTQEVSWTGSDGQLHQLRWR